MAFLPIAIYALVKYLAYSGWCSLLPADDGRAGWRRGLGLGGVRLILGLVVGAGVAFAGAHLAYASRMPLAFGAILLPIRWLEWNLVGVLGARLPPLPHLVLLGASGRLRLWTLGGMLVSFATDALAIVAVGSMRALVC